MAFSKARRLGELVTTAGVLDQATVATASSGDNDTSPASTAFVTGAIADLADSAPSTLNTLNELAAALGDDANFSTTVTNSIAAKAPLASPAFTGNVGIGTSSPQGNLHVEGAAGASGGGIIYVTDADNGSTASDALHISKSGDTAFVYNRESSGDLQLGSGNTPGHVVIKSSGNVGIGTTTPVATLQVKTQTNGNLAFQNSTSVSGGVKLNCFNDAANASSPFEIDGSTLQFNIGASEKMRINSSGNVGIGDTSPDAKLDIFGGNGDQLILDNNGERFTQQYFMSGGTTGGAIWYDSTDDELVLHSTSGNIIAFQTNGSNERMRIDSAGDVGIGTTLTSAKFNVGNGSGNAQLEMASGGANGTYFESIRRDDTNQNVSVGYYARLSASHVFYTGSYTARFTIDANGGANGSDIKLKENIEDISYGLDTVKSLQPRKFKWKETGDQSIGFIAQEVESLIPELISEVSDDLRTGTEEKTKMLHYGAITSVLTKAIQELSAELDAAKDRIATLEG